ncbi:MAG: DUF1326 domain-containing protein, partial [Dehalococcoidia bacterium]|nr:DUF1326 domain-containing protein [Dehalococcoidia bacterium]
ETCNCEVACPCVFLSPPTTGECTVLVAWHIDKGSFGNVALGGLNVAAAVHSPGHMAQVKWRVGLYLDQKASPTQKDALVKVFGGQAGGHPAVVASFFGEVLGVKDAPIEYHAEGKRRSLRVGEIAQAAIEAIQGQGGGEVTVSGHPLCIAPGQPAVAARSSRLTYQDYGMKWEISDKNGFFSSFAYQGP